jgi:hypothetical protein
MDTIGIEIVPSSEQYILYNLDHSKLCDSMPGRNTMRSIFFPTLEMANNVRSTLLYFIINFDRGYHGGELARGIGKSLFTKINDEQLMNSSGQTINILSFVERTQELMKYKCNNNLPKYYYDEFMLVVLKHSNFLPRIKRTEFTLNPFKYKYVETDEKTIRKMGLVVVSVLLKN